MVVTFYFKPLTCTSQYGIHVATQNDPVRGPLLSLPCGYVPTTGAMVCCTTWCHHWHKATIWAGWCTCIFRLLGVNRGFVPRSQGQEQSIKAIKTRQRFLVATLLKLAWKFFPQAGKKQSWVGCIRDAVGFVKRFVCAAKGALGDEYDVTKCASTFIHAYIPNLYYS